MSEEDVKMLGVNLTEKLTIEWYRKHGYKVLNSCLQELADRFSRVYIENFEIIPSGINKKILISEFNTDSNSWKMELDEWEELICKKKSYN